MNYETVIIIGAPRSGTNVLRDFLVQLEGVGTWPCDEINYIWRHGNVRFPTDEFVPEMATPFVQRYISHEFEKLAVNLGIGVVVEKTCANSLRVEFVNEVLPSAKYIFIVRNGLDVVGSAIKRWRAGMDVRYLLRKARYVPLSDLPYYSVQYLLNHLYRITSGTKRMASWGPISNGMEEIMQNYTLEQACAIQWKTCVEKSEVGLRSIPENRLLRITYEELVAKPEVELTRLAEFLNKPISNFAKSYAISIVNSDSVGKGRKELGLLEREINPLIQQTLSAYGYS